MSDEDVAPEVTPETNEPQEDALESNSVVEASDSEINDLEVALKVIEKLRRADAARRVKSRQLTEDAKKWQQHLDSQKTELQLLQEANEALKGELEAAVTEKVRAKIAAEVGLDPELMEFVTGADEKEMRAKATLLAEKAGRSTPLDTHAGPRGNPVVSKNIGANFLSELA